MVEDERVALDPPERDERPDLEDAVGHRDPAGRVDPAEADAMIEDEKLIVVQVNGKVRSKITVAADASNTTVEQIGLADENVIKFTEGKTVRKVIYVPGKLLNIVVS